jgi:hypothetical protein
MWLAIYHWKVLNKGYNFSLNFTPIEGLKKKLWASKVAGVPISRISRLPTWVQPLWPGIKHFVREKVVPSPKFGL